MVFFFFPLRKQFLSWFHSLRCIRSRCRLSFLRSALAGTAEAAAAAACAAASWKELTDADWKDMDIPESKEPTEARRVIFSALASDKSSRELLMADLRRTTPPPLLDPTPPPLAPLWWWWPFSLGWCRSRWLLWLLLDDAEEDVGTAKELEVWDKRAAAAASSSLLIPESLWSLAEDGAVLICFCFSSSASNLRVSISSISAIDSLRSSTNFERSWSFLAFNMRTTFRSHFWAIWIPKG